MKKIFIVIIILCCTTTIYSQKKTKTLIKEDPPVVVSDTNTDTIGGEPVQGGSCSGSWGFTAGTPGIINIDMFFYGKNSPMFTPGFKFSVTPLVLLNEAGDSSDDENGYFTSIEAGVPLFLACNDELFFAITPLAGYAGFKNSKVTDSNTTKETRGWWVYGGVALDFRYHYFFSEIGLVYGPSKNTVQYEPYHNVSVVWKLGFMTTLYSFD